MKGLKKLDGEQMKTKEEVFNFGRLTVIEKKIDFDRIERTKPKYVL